ncbi:hypothetical protein [Amycolatopsis sp. NBC_01480]|uniref:hypothetical protein n=1 Tax=Amycolatopsis sp. NBC_01480 TaxID=2903562 RepID=UPI002E2C29FA|nr:hypothetical protein [Amycolatopsis sp. NBC_01480]
MNALLQAVSEIAKTIRVSSENTGRTVRTALACLLLTIMVVGTATGVAYSIVTVLGAK